MPGGKKSSGRRPKENNARRAKKARAAGPKRTTLGGRKKPGPQAHKNIVSWQQNPAPMGKIY